MKEYENSDSWKGGEGDCGGPGDRATNRALRFTPDDAQHRQALELERVLSRINPLDVRAISDLLTEAGESVGCNGCRDGTPRVECVAALFRALSIPHLQVCQDVDGLTGDGVLIVFPGRQDREIGMDWETLVSASALSSDRMTEARIKSILSVVLPGGSDAVRVAARQIEDDLSEV